MTDRKVTRCCTEPVALVGGRADTHVATGGRLLTLAVAVASPRPTPALHTLLTPLQQMN